MLLRWPAAARDYVVEEAFALAPGFVWQRADHAAQLSGDWQVLRMFPSGASRYFRLRYRSSDLLSTNAVIHFALTNPAGGSVVAGRPFPVEVRASLNAVLVGAAFRVVTTGGARATLTSRSPSPAQDTGLIFVSTTSQQPFEPGLPMEIGETGALEVLLGTGAWPHDGIVPGENILLERLEITPSSSGELTLSLADLQAVTSRWAKDGKWFESVSLHPWQPSVTVQVEPGPAAPPQSAPGGQAPVMGAPAPGKAGVPSSINANADGQGAVDVADLVFVRARLGLDAALAGNARADVNQDQRIDLLDLVAVRNRFSPPASSGERPEPRLSEVAPNPGSGQAPWLEVGYPPWVERYSYALEVRNGAQEALVQSWPEPISGWPSFIVMVFDGEQPMEYLGDPQAPTAVRVHFPQHGGLFNATNDQCLLYLNGQLVDSVVWGNLAESGSRLNTRLQSLPVGGSIGRDGYEPTRWVRFTAPTPGAENGLPTPSAFFPISGSGILSGESTSFSWVDPRYSAVAYELEVDDAKDFQAPLVRTFCLGPNYTLSPGLPVGKYSWRVRPVAGESQGPWSAVQELEVLDLPGSLPSGNPGPRSAQPLGAPAVKYRMLSSILRWTRPPAKDSPMLCLECLQEEGAHPWDGPHMPLQTGVNLCPHEIGHGATAIAYALNHYYGGDIKQDEINFEMFGVDEGPEGDLGHGQVPADVAEMLMNALDISDVSTWVMDISDLQAWGTYTLFIDSGAPWVVEQLPLRTGADTGPVLALGYLETREQGKLRGKIIYVSPFLPGVAQVLDLEALLPAKVKWIFPNVPDGYRKAPRADRAIFQDSDGDGLVDFDETERFETMKTNRDSDDDHIEDKTEIWSYRFGSGLVPRTPDPDGDGFRAELDPDTDNDGCADDDEDRNRNGTLGFYQAGSSFFWKEANESDPFWVDEYQVTLTAQQNQLHFHECTRLEVKVTDRNGGPVEGAEVRFNMDPQIATYGTTGGTPITYLALLTDKDGKGSTDFCAQETEGTVTVEGRYKPCPQGKENKAELKIQILPYDWIFAVQEKAVLTGPVVTPDREPVVRDQATDVVWERYRYKDAGFQKVSGHFFHPKTRTPEQYIHSIAVAYAPSAVLWINGTNANGLTWTRSSTNDRPSRWEVTVASADLEKWPRYLEVSTLGSAGRRTPLLWWSDCWTSGQKRRVKDRYVEKTVSIDWTKHDYEFFFGDGDVNGADPLAWTTPHPDPNGHTGVSFIPVQGIPGYAIGAREQSGWPFDWGFNPWDKAGGVYFEIFNAYAKETMGWIPPAPWAISQRR
ncbi:MAG: hypothetical protein AB9869_15520 [Verrucomicrobiia bacterium]